MASDDDDDYLAWVGKSEKQLKELVAFHEQYHYEEPMNEIRKGAKDHKLIFRAFFAKQLSEFEQVSILEPDSIEEMEQAYKSEPYLQPFGRRKSSEQIFEEVKSYCLAVATDACTHLTPHMVPSFGVALRLQRALVELHRDGEWEVVAKMCGFLTVDDYYVRKFTPSLAVKIFRKLMSTPLLYPNLIGLLFCRALERLGRIYYVATICKKFQDKYEWLGTIAHTVRLVEHWFTKGKDALDAILDDSVQEPKSQMFDYALASFERSTRLCGYPLPGQQYFGQPQGTGTAMYVMCMATCHKRQKQWDLAIELFRCALSINVFLIHARKSLAQCLFNKGDLREALMEVDYLLQLEHYPRRPKEAREEFTFEEKAWWDRVRALKKRILDASQQQEAQDVPIQFELQLIAN